jgi:hypothetical protein
MDGGFVFIRGNSFIEALHDSFGFSCSRAFANAKLYELILLRGGEREIGHGEFLWTVVNVIITFRNFWGNLVRIPHRK